MARGTWRSGLLASCGVLAAGAVAHAQEPASSPETTPICTDRPTKSNGACTVESGHVQAEADLVNASFMRLDGVTTDTWLVLNPTLKYGVTSDLDIEANISPAEIVRTHDDLGHDHTLAGISDLDLRLKYEFLNTAGGVLQAALLPYVKVPTARPGIGNGVVEGGVILPVNYKLNDTLTLTVQPEADVLEDATGGGRHLATAQLASLAITLPKSFTVYGELWGDWDFDTTGTVRQYSADIAASYGVNANLQLDGGLNFGLNRETPGVQAYVGVSQRF